MHACARPRCTRTFSILLRARHRHIRAGPASSRGGAHHAVQQLIPIQQAHMRARAQTQGPLPAVAAHITLRPRGVSGHPKGLPALLPRAKDKPLGANRQQPPRTRGRKQQQLG